MIWFWPGINWDKGSKKPDGLRCRLSAMLLMLLLLTACSGSPQRVVESDRESRAGRAADVGLAHLYRGDFHAAEVAFRRALEIDAGQRIALLGLGSLGERAGDPTGALHWYGIAFTAHPQDAYVLTNYGTLMCRIGDPQQGLAHLELALAMADSTLKTAALVSAGLCSLDLEDYHQAELWLRRALDREPSYPDALFAMAKIAWWQGHPLSSRAFLSRMRSLGLMPREATELCIEVETALGNGQQEETCYLTSGRVMVQVPSEMIAR